MSQPIYIVDAFTDAAFAGNPAAVCPLDEPADAGWMQRVAAEMNLSETVFVVPKADGRWGIRWFTPLQEVELCGHATLAASQAAYETGRVTADDGLVFDSMSGELRAQRDGDGVIWLDFPAVPMREEAVPGSLRESLDGASWFGAGGTKMLALLEDESAVRGYVPDLTAIKAFARVGLIVTAPGDDADVDFVSRFFAPGVGIDEDPVCGSAHCLLTPYWAERLRKTELSARQISARGGTLSLKLQGDRVALGGRAVMTLRGELTAAACPLTQGASGL